jgi:hypothetical protein
MGKKKPPEKKPPAPAQKRPATDTPIPEDVIDSIAHLLNETKFHSMIAWSFAKGKTPKLSGVAG